MGVFWVCGYFWVLIVLKLFRNFLDVSTDVCSVLREPRVSEGRDTYDAVRRRRMESYSG